MLHVVTMYVTQDFDPIVHVCTKLEIYTCIQTNYRQYQTGPSIVLPQRQVSWSLRLLQARLVIWSSWYEWKPDTCHWDWCIHDCFTL